MSWKKKVSSETTEFRTELQSGDRPLQNAPTKKGAASTSEQYLMARRALNFQSIMKDAWES
jgi:hypothetical protein